MTQTSNYGLSQWEKADRIQMEDFNSDNAKIDAALKASVDAVASHTTALAKLGNCQVAYGVYTGTGTYGSSNRTRLNFDAKPLLVLVQEANNTGNIDTYLRLVRGSGWVRGVDKNDNYKNVVAWGDHYVEWYHYNESNATFQFNTSGTKYLYVALLAADE